MQILKAYKFRLEPTEQQAQRLRQLGGCARYVWNHGLAETKRILDSGEKIPSAFELNRMLTCWKKDPEIAFLAEAYTVYIENAINQLKKKGLSLNDQLLSHLSPLGWEHINLTGDYIWRTNKKLSEGKYPSVRPVNVSQYKKNLNAQYFPFPKQSPYDKLEK